MVGRRFLACANTSAAVGCCSTSLMTCSTTSRCFVRLAFWFTMPGDFLGTAITIFRIILNIVFVKPSKENFPINCGGGGSGWFALTSAKGWHKPLADAVKSLNGGMPMAVEVGDMAPDFELPSH